MRVITISGVDGSGKSTQAERLITELESRGEKVYSLHAVQFGLANVIAAKLGKSSDGGDTAATSDTGTSVARASALGILLRQIFIVIDSWRFTRLKKRLAKDGYTAIISDRSFFDIVVNIRFLQKRTEIGILEKIIPQADIAILLSVLPEIIMGRDRPPEQGLAYLEKKHKLLHDRARMWDMTIINANRTPDTIATDIATTTEPPQEYTR